MPREHRPPCSEVQHGARHSRDVAQQLKLGVQRVDVPPAGVLLAKQCSKVVRPVARRLRGRGEGRPQSPFHLSPVDCAFRDGRRASSRRVLAPCLELLKAKGFALLDAELHAAAASAHRGLDDRGDCHAPSCGLEIELCPPRRRHHLCQSGSPVFWLVLQPPDEPREASKLIERGPILRDLAEPFGSGLRHSTGRCERRPSRFPMRR
mmetsp:Transcript_10722/g.41643  ORF Transcript_10722/g.41643 Transcript_10722/m.41643 type:complete len:207 (+) Transcript_10722:2024-2644(+)